MTKAAIENLEHVRDHGKAKPRSRAGYWCRTNGLSRFLWLFEDGTTATTEDREPSEAIKLVRVVGEVLTPAGRSALNGEEGNG